MKKQNIVYKDFKWIQTQAKTIETKCLKRNKLSLSFSAIERILSKGAIISIDDGKTLVIDKDIYDKNKKDYLLDQDKYIKN